MRTLVRRAATSLLLALATAAAMVMPSAPAHAAWASPISLTMQVKHYYSTGTMVQIGYVTGTVQFDDGGSALKYDLTVCRQSSYIQPYLNIAVNAYWVGSTKYSTYITTVYPNYTTTSSGSPCYSSTGTVSGQFTYTDFWNVEFTAYGSTFDGPTHVVENKVTTYSNPY